LLVVTICRSLSNIPHLSLDEIPSQWPQRNMNFLLGTEAF
jgi:hypothetical protein